MQRSKSFYYVRPLLRTLTLVSVSAYTSHKGNHPDISEFFGVVQLMYNFIEDSLKQQAVFEDLVKNTNTKLKTLKSLSNTRWA